MSNLNSSGYIKLINEDIAWLLDNTERSLERDHIIATLRWSVYENYKDCDKNKLKKQLINEYDYKNQSQIM